MMNEPLWVRNRWVPASEMAGWHGWWARLLNSLRAWAERRAAWHAVQVLARKEPLLVEELVQHATIQGEFKEFRGSTRVEHAVLTPQERSQRDQDQALARLAQLSSPLRARRYTKGRRVFTMYEVEP